MRVARCCCCTLKQCFIYNYKRQRVVFQKLNPPSELTSTTRYHQSGSAAKMISLSVDGNISSGKSTLVSKLVNELQRKTDTPNQFRDNERQLFNSIKVGLQVEVIPEPLEKWCDVQGHNLLQLFYQDPPKYNFLFEHYVQLTRLMDIMSYNTHAVNQSSSTTDENPTSKVQRLRIMERSLQNNRYCFMELAKKNGSLHPAEFNVLSEWHSWLGTRIDINLDLIIYLQSNPKTAYERMKSRARASEDLCPFEYLVDLHGAYEDWLILNKSGTKGPHVIVLDANQSQDIVADECLLKLNHYLTNLAI